MKGSKAPKGGKGHGKAHPGFAAAKSQIAAKEGISPDRAGAILAAGARNASPAAKKSNPRLNKVGGAKAPPKGAAKGAKGGGKKH